MRPKVIINGGLKAIDLETLKRIAKTKGINNIGFAEKDYFQEIIMLGVSREAPELVFKGGTALYKLHGLNRFSEDLDFSGVIEESKVHTISEYLINFGYETEISKKVVKASTLLTFIIQGFLYQGKNESKARVQMDVSGAGVNVEPNWSQFFSLYPDIPSFKLKVMALEEVMAEKMRALIVRKKARDLYDIWYLLNKGVKMDLSLIREKLKMYNIELGRDTLETALGECGGVWIKELKPFLSELPNFIDIKQRIEEGVKGLA